MQFHNYEYFSSEFEDENEFYYLCSNNYHKLVDLFMKMKEESIEKELSERINIFKYIIFHGMKQLKIIELRSCIICY